MKSKKHKMGNSDMQDHRNYLLNKLIDIYENSKLFRGENQVTIHIDYRFSEHNLPNYFNKLSHDFKENMNKVCKNLEVDSFIQIIWKDESDLIDRIRLNVEEVDRVYVFLNRENKKNLERNMIKILDPYVNHESWLCDFAKKLTKRLEEGKSIKRYFDLTQPEYAKTILSTLDRILQQKEEIAKRMFSIALFNDSKGFEEIETKILMIMKEFGSYDEDIDILAEENIMNNPGYVYLKGAGTFRINKGSVNLQELQGDIGLSTQLLKHFYVEHLNVRRILVIENLSTFHLFQPKDELVIYLGGYHNTIRREFLKSIFSYNKDIPFTYWGDIDLKSFRILHYLKSKTGIPIMPYRMDLEILIHFRRYAMKIETNDQNKLKALLNKPDFHELHDVIKYMVEHKIRLEQKILG